MDEVMPMDEVTQLIAELEQECHDLRDYIDYVHIKSDSDVLEDHFQGLKRDARLLHNKLIRLKTIVTQQNRG